MSMSETSQLAASRSSSSARPDTPAVAIASLGAATPAAIPFIDLQAQRRRLSERIDRAIAGVLAHGQFIMGPELQRLEERLAAHSGARHAIGCGSGTDALVLALLALGTKPGDAVFVPSFTFAATAEAVALIGATPVFVDVDETSFSIDPASLAEAATATAREGRLRPVGIIAVDLFGQPADYANIHAVAAPHDLWVVADAAQSYGAASNGRRVGTLAALTTTSFFPAKPLGCYGDGGAVFTDDDEMAHVIRSLLFHGRGADRNDMVRIGINGRLDTIQAAILLEKLQIFDEELELRQHVADRYGNALQDIARVPVLQPGNSSAWAQYTVVIDDRDRVAAHLEAEGIPTATYYPLPVHRQTAYRNFPRVPGGLPVSEMLSQRVLSLPMYPYLNELTQDRIIAAVRGACAQRRDDSGSQSVLVSG